MIKTSPQTSLRLSLDDLMKSDTDSIMETLYSISKLIGDEFTVGLWNRNVSKSDLNKFNKQYSNYFSKMNIKITKENQYAWFLVQTQADISKWRYKYVGDDILKGIEHFTKLVYHIFSRDGEMK